MQLIPTCSVRNEHDSQEPSQEAGPADHPELGGVANVVEQYSGHQCSGLAHSCRHAVSSGSYTGWVHLSCRQQKISQASLYAQFEWSESVCVMSAVMPVVMPKWNILLARCLDIWTGQAKQILAYTGSSARMLTLQDSGTVNKACAAYSASTKCTVSTACTASEAHKASKACTAGSVKWLTSNQEGGAVGAKLVPEGGEEVDKLKYLGTMLAASQLAP